MKKYQFILYYILYFTFCICINTVHPITTTYVQSLNLPDYYFGFFFSLMSLGQVIGALFFGYLSDKIGRKWLISIGILGYVLAQFLFGYVNFNPILILVFRVMSGIFVSAPNTLFISMCLDYASEEKMKHLSLLSFCNILGAALGYEVGGSLYTYLGFSIQQVFLFQVITGVLISLIFALSMKDAPIKRNNAKAKFSFKSLINLNSLVYILLISLLTLTIGQILINKYLDTYLIHIGYEPGVLGHYILITGILGALSNLVIIPFIKKVRNKKLEYLLLSFILLSSVLTFITFLVDTNIIYLLFSTHLIYIVLKALITPLEQNELAEYSTPQNNGQIMGARQTILSIGNVVGPLIGSALYVKKSPLIFVVGASIIMVSLFLYLVYFYLKNRKQKGVK